MFRGMVDPPIKGRVTDHLNVAVGTANGLFIVKDGAVGECLLNNCRVSSFLSISGRYLAGTMSNVARSAGPGIQASQDGGKTWAPIGARPISFPASAGASLAEIWQLQVDSSGESDEGVLAGVEPAALFRSRDGGESFELVGGLWDHPDRKTWVHRTGGLGLHTILTHRERAGRVIVGLSSGGVYRSDDAGATWAPKNVGIKGYDVHKVVLDAAGPDVLWAQNRSGIYRSNDAGESWSGVECPGGFLGAGDEFGFSIVSHPVDANTAYIVPLSGASQVYRSANAGKDWDCLTSGLPVAGDHLRVFRDALAVGSVAPFPLVFGTSSGDVFASVDHGDTWRRLASGLPAVLCVRVLD